MNRNVPTLLGIVIILLVVVLVVVVFNYQLMKKLGEGGSVMGTVSTGAVTGTELPKEEIGVSEVIGSKTAKPGVTAPRGMETGAELMHKGKGKKLMEETQKLQKQEATEEKPGD